jgi:hypothetical protein
VRGSIVYCEVICLFWITSRRGHIYSHLLGWAKHKLHQTQVKFAGQRAAFCEWQSLMGRGQRSLLDPVSGRVSPMPPHAQCSIDRAHALESSFRHWHPLLKQAVRRPKKRGRIQVDRLMSSRLCRPSTSREQNRCTTSPPLPMCRLASHFTRPPVGLPSTCSWVKPRRSRTLFWPEPPPQASGGCEVFGDVSLFAYAVEVHHRGLVTPKGPYPHGPLS